MGKIKTSNILYRLGPLLDIECIHLNMKFKTSLYSEGRRIVLIHEINTESKISLWKPNDALSPSYLLGDWCNYCEFQETCAEFR